MDSEQLKELLEYQKTRFLEQRDLVRRDALDKVKQLVSSREIIVITGVRRCGKSSLMRMIADKLISEYKIPSGNVGYINFDDPKLVNLKPSDCDILYQCFLEECSPKHKKYLFLDEIQNVIGWERWLNNLYEFEKVKIFITGSNSSILDSDISRLLTGRNRVLRLLPFSFREFIRMKDRTPVKISLPEQKSKLRKLFKEYLKFGGFPEVARQRDTELLKSYYQDIIYRDIIGYGSIAKRTELLELSRFLASNPGTLAGSPELQKMLGLKSPKTVRNYLKQLEDAYLFYSCRLFDYSIKRQMYNPPKIYMVDAAASKAVGFHSSENRGHILETIVFLELIRRGCEVFYWSTPKRKEVDFVVKSGRKIEKAIQVCHVMSRQKTREREISPLCEAKKHINAKQLLIITSNEEGTETRQTYRINIVPIWKWLIE